ncbi:hypothetical protein SDC9_143393 [bioreactor metagenome]|uniref:Beta-galactosidase trimerisation domain-containing protein n=1 Tax=bioreactor metagenome TaxID=1076179 RepID=A0A645E3Y9_9ZZZZ
MSVYDMLVRKHVQFDIIDDVSLVDGTLSKYEAVILPEVACLTDDGAEAIKKFVSDGGKLLANFDAGMYNEDGSFASTPKLAEVLGLCGTPKLVSSPSVGNAYAISTGSHPITDALSFPRIPGNILTLEWNTLPDTKVLMKVMHPMPSTYAIIPEDGYYPFLCEHKYGSGCAYYICGNYAETVNGRNMTDYANLVNAFADYTAKPVVESDEPGLYETVLRRQENSDRFILHAVNLTGAMYRPLEKLVPLNNVRFSLTLDGFGIKTDGREFKLRTLRGGNILGKRTESGKLTFVLDKLDDYEVIVIE